MLTEKMDKVRAVIKYLCKKGCLRRKFMITSLKSLGMGLLLTFITETRLFKYIENFTTKKGKFSDKKKSDIFHISAQNIDCGYSLEPPRRGGSNEYPQSMFFS